MISGIGSIDLLARPRNICGSPATRINGSNVEMQRIPTSNAIPQQADTAGGGFLTAGNHWAGVRFCIVSTSMIAGPRKLGLAVATKQSRLLSSIGATLPSHRSSKPSKILPAISDGSSNLFTTLSLILIRTSGRRPALAYRIPTLSNAHAVAVFFTAMTYRLDQRERAYEGAISPLTASRLTRLTKAAGSSGTSPSRMRAWSKSNSERSTTSGSR